MNTYMWYNPFTNEHIGVLEQRFEVHFISPVSKTLACGDVGIGAMAEPSIIAQEVHFSLTGSYE